MKIRSRKARLQLAVIGVAAIAAIAVAGGASVAAAQSGSRAVAAPVVINCSGHAVTKPKTYVLSCADGNSYLKRLHWASWGGSAAFASGTSVFNDCTPSCVNGHFHSFTALVALWRPEALPGHAGQRYFTRLTIIYSGGRDYRAGGKKHRLPQTVTFPLSSGGGA